MGGVVAAQVQACLEFLRPVLPAEARERLERKEKMEEGGTFIKRSFTFGGFALSSQSISMHVRTSEEPVALLWRPSNDESATWNEIHASDIKTIDGKGGKTIVIMSKTGDILMEADVLEEPLRDYWLRGLNEVLLNRTKVGTEGVTGTPKSLKERAEKELYFQRRNQELQAKKKEADERKNKYMRDAGGLKYTALAMANRE